MIVDVEIRMDDPLRYVFECAVSKRRSRRRSRSIWVGDDVAETKRPSKATAKRRNCCRMAAAEDQSTVRLICVNIASVRNELRESNCTMMVVSWQPEYNLPRLRPPVVILCSLLSEIDSGRSSSQVE